MCDIMVSPLLIEEVLQPIFISKISMFDSFRLLSGVHYSLSCLHTEALSIENVWVSW